MPEAINVLYESLSGDPPARVLRGPKQSMFFMIASGTVVALRTMPIEVPRSINVLYDCFRGGMDNA
jgi:hypothetical protein